MTEISHRIYDVKNKSTYNLSEHHQNLDMAIVGVNSEGSLQRTIHSGGTSSMMQPNLELPRMLLESKTRQVSQGDCRDPTHVHGTWRVGLPCKARAYCRVFQSDIYHRAVELNTTADK